MVETVDNVKPKCVAKFACRTKVKFQITGGQSIFIATTSSELNVPGPGGQFGGIQLQQANGIVELEWIGELWVLGNQATTVFVWVAPGYRESSGTSGG